jgi:hypothetical protein
MLDISWTDMRRPEVVSKPSLEFCLASTVNATLGRVVGRRDWLPNMWGMYRGMMKAAPSEVIPRILVDYL